MNIIFFLMTQPILEGGGMNSSAIPLLYEFFSPTKHNHFHWFSKLYLERFFYC